MFKPKWRGRKAGGNHFTLIEAAQALVKEAEKLPEVVRIAPGYITQTSGRTNKRRVKFTPMAGGLLARVRGNSSVQEIRIYTKHPSKVQGLLEKIYH